MILQFDHGKITIVIIRKEIIVKITAGEFKARCLKLMGNVSKYHEEIIITKHGKPVAKLCPVNEAPEKSLSGYMKDMVTIHGDIINPIDEHWTVDE